MFFVLTTMFRPKYPSASCILFKTQSLDDAIIPSIIWTGILIFVILIIMFRLGTLQPSKFCLNSWK